LVIACTPVDEAQIKTICRADPVAALEGAAAGSVCLSVNECRGAGFRSRAVEDNYIT